MMIWETELVITTEEKLDLIGALTVLLEALILASGWLWAIAPLLVILLFGGES